MKEKLYLKYNKLPEANIQAEFYMQCKLNNINCMLEYKTSGCRFDAIVYNNNLKIVAAVEVKSYSNQDYVNTNTRQIAKYKKVCKKYNIKLFLICNKKHIEEVITKIKGELL